MSSDPRLTLKPVLRSITPQHPITAGEYNTVDMVAEFDHLIEPVTDDVIARTQYRGSIIMFCPRVDTCEKMRDALVARGMYSAYVVTGETPAEQRNALLHDFKEEKIRCLLSVSVLSTGFDAPSVDCIVLFRATTSPGLYYQMLGRGMRLHPSKTDCLVLDYGGNIRRHGPVTNITPPTARGSKKEDEEEKVKMPDLRRGEPGACRAGLFRLRHVGPRHGEKAGRHEIQHQFGR